MANTLGNYVATMYNQTALNWLHKRLLFGSSVYRGYDAKTVDRFDTVKIHRPMKGTAAAAPSAAVALVPDNITLSMNRWYEFKFAITDKEYAQAMDGLVPDHMRTAAYAVADRIDLDLVGLIPTVPHMVFAAGSTLAVADVNAVNRKLFDNQCDVGDEENMHLILNGQSYQDLVNLSAMTQWQGAGPTGQQSQITGQLGHRYGFGVDRSQNIPSIAYNQIVNTDLSATVTAAAKGATTLLLAGLNSGTEVYVKGTILKVVGGVDTGSEYAIAADTTDKAGTTVTVTINPPLRNALAGSEAIIVGNGTATATALQDNTTNGVNIGFHRDWAALAMGRLPDYSQFDQMKAAQISSITDPVSGLALRTRVYYVGGSSQIEVAVDALWGFVELNPEMACRLEIPVL